MGGLVALDGILGHGREVMLGMGFRNAGDIRGALGVARADGKATKGGLLDGILGIRVVDDPGLIHGLGDALLVGNTAGSWVSQMIPGRWVGNAY